MAMKQPAISSQQSSSVIVARVLITDVALDITKNGV